MTENERLPDEDLPEQDEDDDAGSSAGQSVTSPFSLAVTCYLVRFDLETADDDVADGNSADTVLFWPGAIELTVTIDLTRPVRTAGQAKEACEGHERLREAIAAYAADHTVEEAWPLDLLPTDARIAADTDDLAKAAKWVRELIEDPLRNAAISAEMPDRLAAMGAGVVAILVTSDITEPIEDTAKIINAVGAIIGLLTGVHPLLVACGQRWTRSMVAEFVHEAVVEAEAEAEAMEPTRDVSPLAPEEPSEMAPAFDCRMQDRQAKALGLRPDDTSPAPNHKSSEENPCPIRPPTVERLKREATAEAMSAVDDTVDTSQGAITSA